MARKRRIGLLGGSFNPAHAGHLHISVLALKRLELDEVWWLVAPQNPLKSTSDMASFETRLASARAVGNHPRIRASNVELVLGIRYTVDTIEALKLRFPRAAFVWLMGADNLAQFSRWRRWTRMFALLPIAVMVRPTYVYPALGSVAARRFVRRRIGPRRQRGLAMATCPAWTLVYARPHRASATALRASQTE